MLEDDLRDRARTALGAAYFSDLDAALEVLLGYFDDRTWAEHACTSESLLAGPLKHNARKTLWEDIEPHLGALAWTMLSTGRSALTRDVVQRAFRKANRHRAGKWLDWADRQLGMLVGTTGGHYEFLLRSLAGHLAGRHLAKRGVEEALAVAREPWASEVVAHAVGVLCEDGAHEQAAEIVDHLLDGWESDFSEGMLIRARHLQRVLVGLRAAPSPGRG